MVKNYDHINVEKNAINDNGKDDYNDWENKGFQKKYQRRTIRSSLNKFQLSTHGNKLRKTIDFCMYEKGSS